MNPTKPIILKGKAAKEFDNYQRTAATPTEIRYFKDAEKFYLKHCNNNGVELTSQKRRRS